MSHLDITLTRTINAPARTIWSALTQPNLVANWMMGAKVHSTWAKGAAISWAGEYQGKRFTDKGEVLEVDAPKHLKHTHYSPMSGQDDVPANYHTLDWSLAEADGKTKLTFRQSDIQSQKQADEFKKGWTAMLDKLKETAEAAQE